MTNERAASDDKFTAQNDEEHKEETPENVTSEEQKETDPQSEGTAPDGQSEENKTAEETPQAETEKVDEAEETPKAEEKEAEETPIVEASASSETTSAETQEDADDEDDEEEEDVDYSKYSLKELLEIVKELAHGNDFKKADRVLQEVKPAFDEHRDKLRKEALDKFLSEGGEEADFDWKPDELTDRFDANYQLIRDRKSKHYKELEKTKEENLKKKNEILDRLRELVDGEETVTSLSAIKDIQQEWKSVGQIPGAFVKTLWANYNALMDRFYDQRSIHFELKELDRKKNLEGKIALCERAEELAASDNVKEAVRELNELHEEYKHIGPVPKEDQEPLWQRFKAASDKIYEKRKDYVKELKKDLDKNLEVKTELVEKVAPFAEFNSDRIKEWNAKTRELLEIQKVWDNTGGLPREKAKEVNKAFWGHFKQFFSNKHDFFKRLEKMREENLEKKQKMVEEAEQLQDSQEWDKTADRLKKMQKEWREIGPVPEKYRDEIYHRFKKACDTFFDNKRGSNSEMEQTYQENLKAKEEVCERIVKLAEEHPGDLGKLEELEEEYSAIGFVPKSAIRSIREKFSEAVQQFIEASGDEINEEDKKKVKLMAQLTKIKAGPNSDRKLNQKEHTLRRKITDLQNNITTWKNNLEFFADSKTANKLKEDFEEKIAAAEEELASLKGQLRIVRSVD